MIAQVSGTLVSKELDRVEIMTTRRVAYELAIPLGVYESLPKTARRCCCIRHLVVKEDARAAVRFASTFEAARVQRVLNAKRRWPCARPRLLSTLTADRLIRAIREKDIPTLQSVPRVGRKKAEQLILDLAESGMI